MEAAERALGDGEGEPEALDRLRDRLRVGKRARAFSSWSAPSINCNTLGDLGDGTRDGTRARRDERRGEGVGPGVGEAFRRDAREAAG